jgi:hypothetical protein
VWDSSLDAYLKPERSVLITQRNMFNGAWNFNQPLDSWDVGNAQIFVSCLMIVGLFIGCISYCSVFITQRSMFRVAYKFNQPLNNWNVAKVTSFVSCLIAWLFDRCMSCFGFMFNSHFSSNFFVTV